jgi:hypothetical protein
MEIDNNTVLKLVFKLKCDMLLHPF